MQLSDDNIDIIHCVVEVIFGVEVQYGHVKCEYSQRGYQMLQFTTVSTTTTNQTYC